MIKYRIEVKYPHSGNWFTLLTYNSLKKAVRAFKKGCRNNPEYLFRITETVIKT